MRTRAEIEKEIGKKGKDTQALILEVLLDMRDLIHEVQEKMDTIYDEVSSIESQMPS